MDEGAKQANREIKERREVLAEDAVQKKLDRIIHLLELLIKRVS